MGWTNESIVGDANLVKIGKRKIEPIEIEIKDNRDLLKKICIIDTLIVVPSMFLLFLVNAQSASAYVIFFTIAFFFFIIFCKDDDNGGNGHDLEPGDDGQGLNDRDREVLETVIVR